MSDLQTMSDAVFETNRADIDTQIRTILATKGKTRARFRLRAVYTRTDELIAELFMTTHGPVVSMIDAEHGSGSRHLADVRVRGRDLAPFTGAPDQQFVIRARSRLYVVFGAHFVSGTKHPDLVIK